MTTLFKSIRWGKFLLTILVVAVLFLIGFSRIEIDTDVVNFLPRDDPVVSDAFYIFKHHPIQDQLFIDIALPENDADRLSVYADRVEQRLKESGCFRDFGKDQMQSLYTDLTFRIVENLPLLFTRKELEEQVAPLLQPLAVQKRLADIRLKLSDLEGIGQAQLYEADPLGLTDRVMGRLAPLAPAQNAGFYKGRIVSADGRHTLVIAEQNVSATDTRRSKQVADLIETIEKDLQAEAAHRGDQITLTPVGGYRAALDNETIVRKDVERAILFATLGIALLLIFAFPRPYMGLLALLPALAGTLTAFFVFSLMHRTISIMVLGFGGAIISITVDHGIAYLLFLDRPHQTYGKDASHEVWSIGLLAVLTTIGAFGVLGFSGFPVFEQLGRFAATGILFSFIFVHTVFPQIFPVLPAANERSLPLQNAANRLAMTGKKGALAALFIFAVMLVFARPSLDVSLNSLNTVSRETTAAEKYMSDVWGQFSGKAYLLIEGADVDELQRKSDEILFRLETEPSSALLSQSFISSMVFPGERKGRSNWQAWTAFWHDERRKSFQRVLGEACVKAGFAPHAFDTFVDKLDLKRMPDKASAIPEKYYALLGIKPVSNGSGWLQAAAFTIDETYDAEVFYAKYRLMGRIFDPTYFSNRLGKLLFSIFMKMMIIIGVSVAVFIFFAFLDIQLSLYALIPVVFAFVCTLGTMHLMGMSIGIPGLMLAIILFGMGVDYSLFFVRSYQRYADFADPSFGLIRMAVFMAAVSTMIGFGILCTAEHTLLTGVGWISLLGIGYSFVGTFMILPPLLKLRFEKIEPKPELGAAIAERVIKRYRNVEAYPRMFTRFKIHIDPMFKELAGLLQPVGPLRGIIDIGCGFGVPANWLLEMYPQAKLYGIDPSPSRIRVASLTTGQRGNMTVDQAPHLPEVSGPVDAVFILDMLHYLGDAELQLFLQRVADRLFPKGYLFLRAATPALPGFSWFRWTENLRMKLAGVQSHYRSMDDIKDFLTRAGFTVERCEPSGAQDDLFWFVARIESETP